ncbi:MAG: cation transporter [Acidimicrobiales bacterium]|nr:cation transporter [Acidimicrobiales bacterium]
MAGSAHHHHAHGGAADEPQTARIAIAATANVSFAVVQVVVGLAIGSVVVLADAAHQVVDACGLVIALGAALLARRSADGSMSFGWGKADALGGFVSSLLLLASIVWIGYESIERLSNPPDIEGWGVIAIGVAGLVVNGGSVLLLDHSHEHLSIQAARLHLITDLVGSVLVVVAGVILAGTNAAWIDPVASLVLCALILRALYTMFRRTAHELLDRAPDGLTTDVVATALAGHDAVLDVHHVHVRPLGAGAVSVTAHVVVGEQSMHDAQGQIDSMNELLADELGVAHSTLQLECHACESTVH